MSNRMVELAIEITAKAAAAAAFDEVADAADRMGSHVDDATSKAADAGSRMDRVAEASDRTASSSAQAAGGLGDLGGALSMLPGPLGSVGSGMEALAAPIMGVTGAADLLNFATESTIVQSARAKIALVAQTTATKAAAIGQRILNAAMRANPIGLIITGLTLLVAGFILAYKKSETFRNIVNGAMGKVRDAVGWVVDKVQALVDKVKGPASAIWNGMKGAVSTAFGAVKNIIQGAIDLVQKIIDKIDWAIKKARDLAASVGIGGGHNVTDPPSNPQLPPPPGGGGGGTGGAARSLSYAPNITIEGTVLDRPGTARALQQLLDEHALRLGTQLAVGG